MQLLNNKYFQWLAFAVLIVLVLFLASATIYQLKSTDVADSLRQATNTITVTGKGEAVAIPDIATFSFSVNKEAETAGAVQKESADASNKVFDAIKKNGVEEKDIKTTNYSLYPKYDYKQTVCPAIYPSNCIPGKEVLRGYAIDQTFEVKIRDISKSGTMVQAAIEAGATNISGPNFAVDKEDDVLSKARNAAIDDAKGKAEAIAKGLGVRLVRIVGFNENDNSYYPMAVDSMSLQKGVASSGSIAQVPTGESKYTKTVSVTYEIR